MANITNMMTVSVLLQQVRQIIPNLEMAELEQIAQQLNETTQQATEQLENERATEQLENERDVEARPRNTPFRDMRHPLPHGTLVHHKTTNGHEAIGRYNAQMGVLEWEGQTFRYPSGFASTHFSQVVHPNGRTNGWGINVCRAFLNGEWVSLHLLRR